jgi:endonuclease-3
MVVGRSLTACLTATPTPGRRTAAAQSASACDAIKTRKKSTAKKKKKQPHGTSKKPQKAKPVDAVLKRHAAKVLRRLKADYPDVDCALHYQSAFQLLVATILSAQCTDKRVNLVTKELFARYQTAADFARVPLQTLEKAIKSTGFFRNKAKNIKACSQGLLDKYGGEVPQKIDLLVDLPGVGRKTANVVLGTAYGLATGVVVDTHVGRLSRRMGLTEQKDPVKTEQDLVHLIPKREWIAFSHRMIHHGRRVCAARKPLCHDCSLQKFCPKNGVG